MIHESVLNRETIADLLCCLYGLGEVGEITRLPGGRAGIYLVCCGQERYVLKEFQRGYSRRSIEREPGICAHLRAAGIAAPVFVQTRKGGVVHRHKNRQLTLQHYIEGTTLPIHQAPGWLMEETAALLGRIHGALGDYPLRRYEFTPNWLGGELLGRKAKQLEGYIAAAEKDHGPLARQMAADLRYKLSLLPSIEGADYSRKRITFTNSHGDYSHLQLLCGENHVNAVLDFASACNLPAAWEILRSFTDAHPGCRHGDMNLAALKCYLTQYLRHFPLKENDLRYMFSLYAAQLTLSAYGYKEYFQDDNLEREQLLAFGVWRTQLLRGLQRHGKDYAAELLRHFKGALQDEV